MTRWENFCLFFFFPLFLLSLRLLFSPFFPFILRFLRMRIVTTVLDDYSNAKLEKVSTVKLVSTPFVRHRWSEEDRLELTAVGGKKKQQDFEIRYCVTNNIFFDFSTVSETISEILRDNLKEWSKRKVKKI